MTEEQPAQPAAVQGEVKATETDLSSDAHKPDVLVGNGAWHTEAPSIVVVRLFAHGS